MEVLSCNSAVGNKSFETLTDFRVSPETCKVIKPIGIDNSRSEITVEFNPGRAVDTFVHNSGLKTVSSGGCLYVET